MQSLNDLPALNNNEQQVVRLFTFANPSNGVAINAKQTVVCLQ